MIKRISWKNTKTLCYNFRVEKKSRRNSTFIDFEILVESRENRYDGGLETINLIISEESKEKNIALIIRSESHRYGKDETL